MESGKDIPDATREMMGWVEMHALQRSTNDYS